MRRAVFLDRDGVLCRPVVRNGRAGSPRSLEEFELLPGVAAAVERLRQAGLMVVVVTNQPDVARGFLALSELERMHAGLRKSVALDAIYACTHDDQDRCPCRKPKPGLLLRAREDLGISLKNSFLVGDRRKDIQAGKAVGCRTFLVGEVELDPSSISADFVVRDLEGAVDLIVRSLSGEQEA